MFLLLALTGFRYQVVLLGRKDDARRLFERLLTICNDVGLLSEEYDPKTGQLLGHFPQALSHIALINSAFNLDEEKSPRNSGRIARWITCKA